LAAKNITAVRGRLIGSGGGDDGDKFAKPDKYKVFKDDDSSVILDVEEERALLDSRLHNERPEYEEFDQFAGFDTSREYRTIKTT